MPQTVTEYLQRARECSDIADKLSGKDKDRLLDIAKAWLKLAVDRAKQLNLPPPDLTK